MNSKIAVESTKYNKKCQLDKPTTLEQQGTSIGDPAEQRVLFENNLQIVGSKKYSCVLDAFAGAMDPIGSAREVVQQISHYSSTILQRGQLPNRLQERISELKVSLKTVMKNHTRLAYETILLDLASLCFKVKIVKCQVKNPGSILVQYCFSNHYQRKIKIFKSQRGWYHALDNIKMSPQISKTLFQPPKLSPISNPRFLYKSNSREDYSFLESLLEGGKRGIFKETIKGSQSEVDDSQQNLKSKNAKIDTLHLKEFKSENLENISHLVRTLGHNYKSDPVKKIEERKRLSVASTPFNSNTKDVQDYPFPQQSWKSVQQIIPNQEQSSFISQESLLFPTNISDMGIYDSLAKKSFPSTLMNRSLVQKQTKRVLKPSFSLKSAGNNKTLPVILDIQKERIQGRLKFFDHKKKFGFIVAQDGSQTEYFCHFDDFKDSKISLGKLKELVRNKFQVSFECLTYIGKDKQGRKAVNIQIEKFE